jgi:hypothetical protein
VVTNRTSGKRPGCILAAALAAASAVRAAEVPTAEMFRVLEPVAEGPRITPYLTYQIERAWAFDAVRQARFARVATEADLVSLQDELRRKALALIGGLPEARTPLNARVTGTIPMDGYRIDKLVFESLPGLHVTALVYVPDAPAGRKPAVLLACGHSPIGKAHPPYQEIAVRLARRGYQYSAENQAKAFAFLDRAFGRGAKAALGEARTLPPEKTLPPEELRATSSGQGARRPSRPLARGRDP